MEQAPEKNQDWKGPQEQLMRVKQEMMRLQRMLEEELAFEEEEDDGGVRFDWMSEGHVGGLG